MPKHTPTFKHLLSAPTDPYQAESNKKREKSVNELLASSRAASSSAASALAGQRDLPPHIAGRGGREDHVKVWVPGDAGDTGLSGGGVMGDGGVHPYVCPVLR